MNQYQNQPNQHKVRDYRELPFAYQDKPALRYMRQQLDKQISTDDFRNLRNIYMALTEIASNKASQTIDAPNRTLLTYSGLKDWRTIKKALKDSRLGRWSQRLKLGARIPDSSPDASHCSPSYIWRRTETNWRQKPDGTESTMPPMQKL